MPIEVFERFHSLLLEGRAEAAFRLAGRSLEVCPLAHRLRYFLALALLERGEREAAREHLESLGRFVTTSRVLRERLAEVVEAPGEHDENGLGRLVDVLTSATMRREEAARQEAAAHREAAARARAARTPWPPSTPIEEADCEPPTVTSLVRAAALAGVDGGAAQRAFRAALALEPGCEEAAFHVAQQLDWDGKGAQARAVCERAVAVNPQAERVWRFLADLKARKGDVAGARESLLRALERAADRFEVLLALARLDRRAQDLVAAERWLREALALHRDRAVAWCELAGVLAAQERIPEAAEATLQEVVWSDSFQEFSLVSALRSIPEPSAAESELAEALRAPDPGDRIERLGRLLLARGDRRGATRILRWLLRYPVSGRDAAVRLLFEVQAEEADWAGLLDSASEALAAGWPDFEEAFRLRRRALEALARTAGATLAEG